MRSLCNEGNYAAAAAAHFRRSLVPALEICTGNLVKMRRRVPWALVPGVQRRHFMLSPAR